MRRIWSSVGQFETALLDVRKSKLVRVSRLRPFSRATSDLVSFYTLRYDYWGWGDIVRLSKINR